MLLQLSILKQMVLKGVRFQRNGGTETFDIPCDNVILATGQTDQNLLVTRIHVYFMPEIMQMEQQI